jgi:hypothetical protein
MKKMRHTELGGEQKGVVQHFFSKNGMPEERKHEENEAG